MKADYSHLEANGRLEERMLKLHLGAGKIAIPGYINIDILSEPGIDVIADLRALPFRDQGVDFIYCCAAIEHFGRKEWKRVISHWSSKLKQGGILRVSTADFSSVCERYVKCGNIEELLGLVVGGQKNGYDRHGMIFDFELLKSGLKEAGFTNIRKYDWRDTELGRLRIDDYSQAYLPHMDKENGQLMMLNVIAEKAG